MEGETVMRKLMNIAVLVVVAGSALVLGQAGDASKVLADMRTALGGADKVAAVKTLTAVGLTQRTNAEGATSESEVALAMELPDKYVARTVLANLGSMSVYRNAGFNGASVINETETPPNLSGGAHMIMIREDDGDTPSAEQKAASEMRMLLAAKKDFARMTVGMFGSSFDAFPLQFTYAGQAESVDGKAHVIGLTGPDGFDARLFVDAQTNLPLMLSWSDKEPLQMVQMINRGGGPGGGRGAQTMMADAQARSSEAEANRRTVEYRIYYSNFKTVDGVKLPHTMQRSVDGKTTEETTFDRIKINPKIDSKRFAISK
jgi:hypothetical protein